MTGFYLVRKSLTVDVAATELGAWKVSKNGEHQVLVGALSLPTSEQHHTRFLCSEQWLPLEMAP